MSGQVTIHVNGDGEKLVVPLTAVVRDGAERFVLVEEEQTKSASVFQKQTVVLGQRMGKLIEVRGGQLFPGDRVVTQGSHELGSFFTKGVLSVNKETERDIGLQVEPVSPQTVVETLSVDGMVDVPPTRRTVAASQMSGSIQRILVDRGEKVARGQVLAEIVSQEFQNLQLDLLRAQLEADLRETSLSNLRHVGDAVPLRQLWETESQLNQASSRRDSAKRRLRAAGLSPEQLEALTATKTLIATLPVRAPIDGVVTEFDKVLGHVIRADEPVFEIHDLSQVWVQALISERDMPRIRLGQTARVRLVADPTEAISGTVVRSGRSVGADDRTLAVWIELTQMPRISVQHNMLARVTVEIGTASSLLAVPREAVVREGTRAYVFVQKEDSTFERRFVQLGRSDDTKIEVRRGLSAGEPIAVRGAAALQTGYAALR
jgi:Cu(I)/Ag(I) efflux system membrane fusion protein/cobalt-zinc-cadmium efflux system membrane fusion protein